MSVVSFDSEDSYADSSDVPSDREPLLAGQAKKPRPQPSAAGRTAVVRSSRSTRKDIPLTDMAAGTGTLMNEGYWY